MMRASNERAASPDKAGRLKALERADTLVVPDSLSTFVEIVRWRAETQPDRLGYTFLLDGDADEVTMTFGELDRRARGVAALLQSRVAPGDRALLLYPPGLDYIAAFFGCLYVGVIAVPAYPPRMNRSLERIDSIARDAQAAIGLTSTSILPAIERAFSSAAALATIPWVCTDALSDNVSGAWLEPVLTSSGTALLQYTSGSTGSPKGVMISHENLIRNHALIRDFFGVTPQTRTVFWLPPYHDMGLISGVLQACFFGTYTVLMSPLAFLQRPLRWLQAVSRTRATISGGPNFAYDLCARSVTEEQLAALDLSSWEVAFVGAEPVRPDVLDRFAEVFAPCGFRREALHPCYGLAEATLIVTGGDSHEPPVVRGFQRQALEAGWAIPAGDGAVTRLLVGCGHAPASQEVRIVDPATSISNPPNRVGEIWVRGASVAGGYWNQPMATEATFGAHLADTHEGPFLRTGDLGFISGDELFITSRIKDLIIIRGRNLHPNDIEHTVALSHPALRPHSCGVFSVDLAEDEGLVIVQEVERTARHDDLQEAIMSIREAVAQEHEVQTYAIVLIKPGSIPKTSSGKIQRHRCRQDFLEGKLAVLEQFTQEHAARLAVRDPYTPPQTPEEDMLASIWIQVFGVERIGIHENFFALGGDSLLGMQIVGHARQRGIDMSIEQLAEHPTVATLAAAVRPSIAVDAEQDMVQGVVPLTPRQHLFFEQGVKRTRAELTLMEVHRYLDPRLVGQAVRRIVEHHDALRMRFHCDESGWHACNAPEERGEVFSSIDVSGLRGLEQQRAIEQSVREIRRSVKVSKGPIIRVGLFDRGIGQAQLMLFAIHHLVVDGLSAAILREDLQTAMEQLGAGEQIQLPAKTTSYKGWAERLADYAQSPVAQQELAYWLDAIPSTHPPLPVDHPDGIGREGKMQRLRVSLDESQTDILLREILPATGGSIVGTVLTALGVAFREWTGHSSLLLELTGHGREPLFADVDLSRTLGWFTTRFPVLLEFQSHTGLVQAAGAVHRHLQTIPHNGIGYGILRYLSRNPDHAETLRRLPQAEVGFNYQGNLDRLYSRSSLFAPIDYLPKRTSNRQVPASTWIQVMSNISHGQLHVRFEYHENVYISGTIERLSYSTLKAMQTMIAAGAIEPLSLAQLPAPAHHVRDGEGCRNRA
ncbi:MAG TPA: AMP-binding protein [Chloroflexota bacterium]